MASVVTDGAHGGLPKESGYTDGFLLLSASLLLGALAAMRVPSIRRDPRTHQEPEVMLRHAEMALVPGGTLVGDEPE